MPYQIFKSFTAHKQHRVKWALVLKCIKVKTVLVQSKNNKYKYNYNMWNNKMAAVHIFGWVSIIMKMDDGKQACEFWKWGKLWICLDII